ncbi:MAG: cytochrome p450 [Lasallia pustulata]|nr:MAG: cytochrome p450 [Lasallia pustulata]
MAFPLAGPERASTGLRLSAIVVACAIAALVVSAVISAVRSYRRLQDFKGPTLACFSDLWIFKATLLGNLNQQTSAVLKQYGPLARIGPNHLVTEDVDLLRHMSAARSVYTRSDWYDGMKLDPNINNVISERNDQRHTALRAKMAAGYSGKENPGLEKSIDDRVQDLVNLIGRKYISTGTTLRTLDFAQVAQYFTMDVLTDVAFGAPFGYLNRDEDVHDYIKTIRSFMPVLELKTNHPVVNALMGSRLVKALLAPTAHDRTGMGKVMGVAKQAVQARYGPKKIQRDDMLGSFVRHGLTQQEAESESLLQIMAGADSTATAVRCIFLHLLTNPRVYSRLLAEILSAHRAGSISSPIRDAEAKQLPYLQACIKEGLRIWPPLTGLMTKRTPPAGDTFKDVFIPGNTDVSYSAWATHHNTRTFGEDAAVFRPERWLEARGEEAQRMERSVELVFGSGRYGCLGKNVAFVELNKVFVELIRRFDFSLVNPIAPMKTRCNGIFLQWDMFVRVTELDVYGG